MIWFAILACGLSYPLILNLGTHVPGPPGDNFGFVWNFWWFRFAPGAGLGYFECPYLFAPFGTSLILHTHTALESLAGATLLARLPIVTAHNVILLAGLAANGIATYALAYSIVKRVLPSVLAGVIFATSAYVTLHLIGHFNLVHAWVLPLAALAWTTFLSRPSLGSAVLVAPAFAAAMYSDYYYFVYTILFAGVWTIVSLWSFSVRWDRPWTRAGNALVVALMAASGVLIAVILTTGGFEIELPGRPISVRHIRNPLTALWVLFLAWLALRCRLSVGRRTDAEAPAPVTVLRYLPVAAAIALILTLPLISGAITLIAAGDYVTPRPRWQSAPGGVDVLTFATGNPMHSVYGRMTTALVDSLGIGLIDQSAWIGLVPLLLLACALKVGAPREVTSRKWALTGIFFLVWSAGPFLHVGGAGTGILLPQFFVRFVPLVSNARIPGRAFIMVILATAMLSAVFLKHRGWGPREICLLIVLALIDGAVLPYPLSRVPVGGRIEQYLVGNPHAGAVLEIPTGLTDGFGGIGRFDLRALLFQIEHERPLVGGYISRIADRIKDGYQKKPALAALIAVSSGQIDNDNEPLPDDLATPLAADGIRYVVFDRDLIRKLTRSDLERRGLRFLMEEGARELYSVGK